MKLAKENKNPKVALMFYGETYRIRTIFREKDLDDRVMSFYDNMDTFYTNRDMTLPDNNELECAVNRVLTLIEQLVHSPNSSQGSPKRRVSPCTAEQSNETSDFQLGTQDDHSPGVRAIELDFGSSTSVDSIPENDRDAWRPVIVQESKTSNNIDNNMKMPSANGFKRDCSTIKENEIKTNNRSEENANFPLEIDPYAEWKHIFSLLTRNGWKWRRGGLLYDNILVKPGHKVKGGEVGVDFFPTDAWGHGDGIKKYMHEKYGWVGPQASIEQSSGSEGSEGSGSEASDDSGSEGSGHSHEENASSGEESDDQLVDDNSEEENENDIFEYVEDDKMIHGLSWSELWKRMQSEGWRIALDKNKKPIYLGPGSKQKKGDYGKNVFNLRDVRQYARDKFCWKGEIKIDASNVDLPTARGAEKTSRSRSSDSGKHIKKKKKKRAVYNSPETEIVSHPNKRTRKQATDHSKGSYTKRQKRGYTSILDNSVTWQSLKDDHGWTCKRAGKYCNLHDWYYIRPGFTPSSKSAKIGTHYFLTEHDAVRYASEHKNILTESVPSSAPNTPSDCDETSTKSSNYSGDGSDEESFEPFALKDVDDCWWLSEKMPKFLNIWTIIRKKLNVKHNGDYYILPDGTRCSTVEEMQLHLCQNGLPPTPSGITLNEDEAKQLTRFASLAHMPKRFGNFPLDQDNSITIFTSLPGGSSFDNNIAWEVLKERFGARFENGKYFIDCIPNGKKNYPSVHEIRQAVRSHGIVLPSWADSETVEHQLALLLWSSVLPLPVQESDEKCAASEFMPANKTDEGCNQEVSEAARRGDKGNDANHDFSRISKTKVNRLPTDAEMEDCSHYDDNSTQSSNEGNLEEATQLDDDQKILSDDNQDERSIEHHVPLTQEHPTDNNLNRFFGYDEGCDSPSRNMEDDAQSVDISTLLDTTNIDLLTSPNIHGRLNSTQVHDFYSTFHPPHDENNEDETNHNPKKVLFRDDLN
mmetsp:Transcript_11477/g.21461  ORF Transcript_11477/g.21461 Transcript_11477/m.21461 type:complete len:979 (-) Transcript_11477:1195-4131(-)